MHICICSWSSLALGAPLPSETWQPLKQGLHILPSALRPTMAPRLTHFHMFFFFNTFIKVFNSFIQTTSSGAGINSLVYFCITFYGLDYSFHRFNVLIFLCSKWYTTNNDNVLRHLICNFAANHLGLRNAKQLRGGCCFVLSLSVYYYCYCYYCCYYCYYYCYYY